TSPVCPHKHPADVPLIHALRPRPPHTPLLPYTTLFRSGLPRRGWSRAGVRIIAAARIHIKHGAGNLGFAEWRTPCAGKTQHASRSEEHTSGLQSLTIFVFRPLLEQNKQ